ncbi:MAG: ATP-binding protein [Verrucomicrobiales bacterium]|nr:ATP-binding protein [Verrucomicrobiales bacterium]
MHSVFPLPIPSISELKRPDGLTTFAWKMMLAEERLITRKNQRLITLLIVSLVPLFSVLDYFAYPEYFTEFLQLRILCVVVTLVAYAAMITPFGRRYYRGFTVLLPLIPAFFISAMILVSQDPGTPYYAGLTLCIVAIGFVFHWTYREAFFATVAIAVMYFVASSPAILNGMDPRTAAGFVNNCIFIAAKGVVIVLGCLAHYRYRVGNFIVLDRSRKQQIALRKQKREIEKTFLELKETEGKLIQSEKMASLGQLSAGVIHEIGNPLNYSNQALFLLRRLLVRENENEEVKEAMNDIQDSIERMKAIVKELREFSHKSSEVQIEYPVSQSVEVALRMLGKEIEDSEVSVTSQVSEELRIDGVKNQITQVLINLVHNSIQALDKAEMSGPKRVDITGKKTGDRIEITIRDNGPGIGEDAKKQIFDPFFTTKEVGEGTGLGLSISFRIIESHGGELRVDSAPGDFTEFTIVLPLTENESGTEENFHHLIPTKKSDYEQAIC